MCRKLHCKQVLQHLWWWVALGLSSEKHWFRLCLSWANTLYGISIWMNKSYCPLWYLSVTVWKNCLEAKQQLNFQKATQTIYYFRDFVFILWTNFTFFKVILVFLDLKYLFQGHSASSKKSSRTMKWTCKNWTNFNHILKIWFNPHKNSWE